MEHTLSIMSTLAVELAMNRWLLPAWEALGTLPAVVDWNPTAVLLEKIAAGARADIVVAIDEPIRRLVSEGILLPETVTPIARAGFGLAVPKGTPHPDISTPEAFCKTVLSARSVAYSRTGASGIYFAELIERLGISKAVNDRAVIIPAGFVAGRLLTGEADLAVQQVSELMAIDGVEVVGPFPDDLQKTTDFSAAIFSDARSPLSARAFLRHLTTPAADAAYRNGGLASRLPQPE